MDVKLKNVFFISLVPIYLWVCVVFSINYVNKDCYNGMTLSDSYMYLEYIKNYNFNIENIKDLIFSLNYIIPFSLIKLSSLFSYEYIFTIVTVINFIILILAIRLLPKNINDYALNRIKITGMILLFPFVFISLPSVGKEIVYILIIVIIFRDFIQNSILLSTLFIPLMILTRSSLLLLYLIVLCSFVMRGRYWISILLISLILPLLDFLFGFNFLSNENRINLSLHLNQASSHIMSDVASLQKYPFVALLLSPIVFCVSIVSSSINILNNVSNGYGYGSILSISSIIFIGLLLLSYKKIIYNTKILFFLCSCIYVTSYMPISQARYYLPLYIIVLYAHCIEVKNEKR